jgi:hypothetical protein
MYAGCDFYHAECDLYTQSVISTRNVMLKRTNVITTITTVGFNKHKSDFYTQTVMLTRMRVIITLTKLIMTLLRVKTTLCV